MLQLMVAWWNEIEETSRMQPGPYIYSATKAGLRQIA
jgi:hypothetical protein